MELDWLKNLQLTRLLLKENTNAGTGELAMPPA
jgi:hypothetical protein